MSPAFLGYVLLAVAALGCLAVFRPALLQVLRREGKVGVDGYRFGDGVFATILALFFVVLIHGAVRTPPAEDARLTIEQIAQGGVLYLFLLGSVLLNLFIRGLSIRDAFGWEKLSNAQAVKRGAIYGWAAYPVVIACYLLTVYYLGQPKPQAMVQFFLENSGWEAKAIVILMAVVMAPICEEVIFRGYLYGVLKRFGGTWCAVVVSAMLFSAIHIDLATLPALFVFGLLLAFAYERSGSLKVPLMMHAVFNGTSLIVSLLFPQV